MERLFPETPSDDDIEELPDLELWVGDISDTDFPGNQNDAIEIIFAATEAIDILRKNREMFEWLVSELVEVEVVTDGAIRDWLEVDSRSI